MDITAVEALTSGLIQVFLIPIGILLLVHIFREVIN